MHQHVRTIGSEATRFGPVCRRILLKMIAELPTNGSSDGAYVNGPLPQPLRFASCRDRRLRQDGSGHLAPSPAGARSIKLEHRDGRGRLGSGSARRRPVAPCLPHSSWCPGGRPEPRISSDPCPRVFGGLHDRTLPSWLSVSVWDEGTSVGVRLCHEDSILPARRISFGPNPGAGLRVASGRDLTDRRFWPPDDGVKIRSLQGGSQCGG